MCVVFEDTSDWTVSRQHHEYQLFLFICMQNWLISNRGTPLCNSFHLFCEFRQVFIKCPALLFCWCLQAYISTNPYCVFTAVCCSIRSQLAWTWYKPDKLWHQWRQHWLGCDESVRLGRNKWQNSQILCDIMHNSHLRVMNVTDCYKTVLQRYSCHKIYTHTG